MIPEQILGDKSLSKQKVYETLASIINHSSLIDS